MDREEPENNKISKNENNKIIIIIVFIILIIIIIAVDFFKNKIIDKRKGDYQNLNFKINMSFALNINKNGSISEHIYKAFDHINKRQTEINKILSKINFFNSTTQVEVSKKTILTDEIKEKLIDNEKDDKKIYVLISFLVQKLEVTILDKSELRVKDFYQNSLKEIENSNSSKRKDLFKNIIEEIGFYVPNEVIFGGRIDITFELKEGYNITNLI